MDRRTVLAFALIGLILVLMPYYIQFVQGDPPQTLNEFTLPPNEESALRRPDRTSSPESPAQMGRPELSKADTHITAPSDRKVSPSQPVYFQARDVIVDTDLYRAVISTRGAVITSWQLKTYFDLNGNWLELIRPNGAGLGASVSGTSLNDIEFTA
jgi:YidC/Oxa1 family membrane protein insertase